VFAQDSPIRVKRTFVPHTAPETWPDKDKDWVPVSAVELEQLLEAANSASKSDREILWLNQADYSAVFNPALNLISGEALFEWRASESRPDMLPLEPSNLSLRTSRWQTANREAIVGSDANNKQWVVSDNSENMLVANWSRSGRKKLAGIEFDLKIPQALVSAIHLSLPSGWTIQSTIGLVQQIKTSEALPNTLESAQQPTSWRIDLGTASGTRLLLVPTKSVSTGTNQPFVFSHTTRFAVRSGSIDAISDIDLTLLGDSLPTSVDVLIPKGFVVQGVEQDDASTSWTQSKISANHITVPLKSNRAIRSTQLKLILRRSVRSSARIALTFPQVARGMFQSGLVSVSVSSPIIVATYSTNGLRQTEANATDDLMQMGFRQHHANAEIVIQGSRANDSSERINVREYAVFADKANGDLEIDLELTSQDRGQFEFRGLFPKQWEITSVELIDQPVGSLLQWAFERPAGANLRWQKTHQVFRIQFSDGLPFKKPTRIRVTAELPNRSSRKRHELNLPAVLSLHEGSLDLVVAGRSTKEWKINYGSHATSLRLDPITPQGLSDRTKWAANASADDNETPSPPDFAWHTFVWDKALALADAVVAVPSKSTSIIDRDSNTNDLDAAKDDQENNHAKEPVRDNLTDENRPVVSMLLNSRIVPGVSGRDEHALSWRFIYDVPLDQLSFRLPSRASLLRVDFNGQSVAATELDGQWQVPLSDITAGDVLMVKYTLPSEDVYLRGTYQCQIPIADVNVAGCRWNVEFPQSIAIVEFSGEFTREDEGQATNVFSWLFGPLGRHKNSKPFDLHSIASWQMEFEQNFNADEQSSASWLLATATCGTSPQSLTLHLCDRSRLRSMSWLVLVVTILIGVSLRVGRIKQRGRIGLLWLTTCIASSTIVPPIFAELIGSAILGTIFSTLIPRSLIRRRATKEQASEQGDRMPSTVSLRRVPSALVLFVGAMIWQVCGGTHNLMEDSAAAQDDVADSPRLNSIEVLVPYLGMQFPADDIKNIKFANQVFVTTDDLRNLRKLAQTVPSNPTRALVTSARYFVSHPPGERPLIEARLRIAVLIQPELATTDSTANENQSENIELVLPIPARFLLGRDACHIDGVSIPVLPDANGQNVRITIPSESQWETLTRRPSAPPLPSEPDEVGLWKQMTLTLQFLPESILNEDLHVLRLPIPSVADTTVNMQVDPQATVEIGRTALKQNAAGLYVVAPTDRLDLVWGTPEAVAGQGTYSVVLNSHLEMHPSWIDRKTHARYKIESGAVHQVSWHLPRGARIDTNSLQTDQPSDIQVRTQNNGITVVVEFKSPQTNSFDLSFNWQQFNRANANALPAWEIPSTQPGAKTSVPVTSHSIGIAPANGFRIENEAIVRADESTIDEWLKIWATGTTPRRPVIVVAKDRFDPAWSNVAALTAFRTVERQDQVIRISETSAEWEFKAELTTSRVPAFRHALFVGNDVLIDSVAVESDDVDRLSHWYWDRRNGTVYLQLKAPTSGAQTVTLRGRLPISNGSTLLVPNARFKDATSNSSMLIYHPSDIHVHVEGAQLEESGTTRPDEESSKKQSITGRFLLRGLEPVQLKLERLRQAASGFSLVRFRPADNRDEYIADMMLQLNSYDAARISVQLPGWIAPGSKPQLRFSESELKLLPEESNDSTLVFEALDPKRKTITFGGQFRVPIKDGKLTLSPPLVKDIVIETVIEQSLSDFRLTEVGPQVEIADVTRFKNSYPTASKFDLTTHRFKVWDSQQDFEVHTFDKRGLSTLVMHVVRTGKRRPAAGLTRVFLNATRPPEFAGDNVVNELNRRTEFKFRLPQASKIISVRVDGKHKSVTRKGNIVVVSIEQGLHQLDILWHQELIGQQLKIRRSQLELPTVETHQPAESYCLIIPTKGTTIFGVAEPTSADVNSLLSFSSQWLEFNNSTDEQDRRAPGILLNRILGHLQNYESGQDAAKQIEGMINQLARDESSRNDQASDSWLSMSNEPPIVTVVRADQPVEMWVVDQRLNQLLLGILAAILAAPFLAVFLRLETSDLLARYPMMSWCLIGLVWWTCLVGSLLGFALFVTTLLSLIGQGILTRYRRVELNANA
jgi:hypothetical protein